MPDAPDLSELTPLVRKIAAQMTKEPGTQALRPEFLNALAAQAALAAAAFVGNPLAGLAEEYGHEMTGGGIHVWNLLPELLEVYPLEDRVTSGQRFGGHVVHRRIVVIDPWEEVTP